MITYLDLSASKSRRLKLCVYIYILHSLTVPTQVLHIPAIHLASLSVTKSRLNLLKATPVVLAQTLELKVLILATAPFITSLSSLCCCVSWFPYCLAFPLNLQGLSLNSLKEAGVLSPFHIPLQKGEKSCLRVGRRRNGSLVLQEICNAEDNVNPKRTSVCFSVPINCRTTRTRVCLVLPGKQPWLPLCSAPGFMHKSLQHLLFSPLWENASCCLLLKENHTCF